MILQLTKQPSIIIIITSYHQTAPRKEQELTHHTHGTLSHR